MAEMVIDLPLTIENVALVKEQLGDLEFQRVVFTTDQIDLAGWQLLKYLELKYPELIIELTKKEKVWEEFVEMKI